MDRAGLSLLAEFKNPTAVIIKHAIPCGVAETNNIYNSWVKACQADELSAFGGIYASGVFNFTFYEIIYFGIALNISAALGSFSH